MGSVWLAGGLLAATFAAGLAYGGHVHAVLDSLGRAGGLHVRYVQVTGQKETSDSAILAALGLEPETSVLGIDAAAARRRLIALPWISEAEVRTVLPGVLEVSVRETTAFAQWDDGAGRRVIDRDGNVLADSVEPRFRHLPLVVGAGANRAAAGGLAVIEAEPAIAERLLAAVYVSGRRWDLMLSDGVLVQLPQRAPEAALARLAVLQEQHRLLDRAVARIDMRLADRTTLRLAAEPVRTASGLPGRLARGRGGANI